ncbi:uncharacterized protein LOC131489644, partial [Neofelis nebulosa]|uniref:uncharacterized protein LOC131489644 n=1 Tax=Neofelis nebulosa TaxID=61452 RepID=UPI00272DC0BE
KGCKNLARGLLVSLTSVRRSGFEPAINGPCRLALTLDSGGLFLGVTRIWAYHLGARPGYPQALQTPSQRVVPEADRDVRTRGQNLSLDIRRGKLITLCHSEWPTFGVGWPTEGTFCLPIIAKALPAPAAPLVAPLGEPGRREVAAAPEPGGREAIAAPGPIENETDRKGPAGRTRGRTQEERERIQLEARKLVPGDDGQPTSNPDLINAAFPLTRPPQDEWDYNTAEAAETPKACIQGIEGLLRTLGTLGYRASAKKAQICKSEVTYLGYLLKGGQRWLTDARKETVLRIPRPQTPQQVREFLGSAGFCGLWIPGFAELAKPLYQATKDQQPYSWTEEAEQAFQQIKTALLSAPALGLPDVSKPFHLYVDENRGIAKAVLTQHLGPWRRPVAYLSKKLDPVAAGWPPCLRMIAATALMVKDADKLTMGQELQVTTPYAIEGILKQPPDRWLSNARLTHYQGLLLNPLRVIFTPQKALNPASLLPDPDMGTPLHDCADILAQVYGVREDLQDQPLSDADTIWFTDGSSFVHQGQRYAGAAVTSETEVVWAEALPSGTSAQKAELKALTQALKLGRDRKLTVYTDSRYAFATAHVH